MPGKLLIRIISLILITAFVGRLSSPLAVLAQSPPLPPEAPSAPSAPENNNTPPVAPIAPTGPTAPTAPSAPSGPSSVPAAPTYPSPTGDVLPTGETLPAEEVLPTASNPFTFPTGYESYSSSLTEGESNTSAGSGSVNDPYNYLTGPGSYNYGQEIINQSLEKVNQNLAEMQNKIDSVSSTGFNYANFNTLSGEVISGNVEAIVNLMNKLNSNISGLGTFANLNLYGQYLGDIELQFTDGSPLSAFVQASETVSKNAVTGPLSENYAISDGNFTVKEANGNDAVLTNDINLLADSGNNSASINTGNGIVQTGDANALANIINLVNTNINAAQWFFGVINIFGELLGNIILPKESNEINNSGSLATSTNAGNQNTGPGSTNYAGSTSNTTEEFTNVNNADILSNLNIDANTGNNNASINTGGGYVSSGMADAAVANTTVANTNTVDGEGTVWLVIVNEMGKWVGHIVGNPYGTNTASNSLPVTTQTGGFGEQTYGVLAENNITGPDSTNVSTVNQNNQSSVENINNAAITNNITADANTGNNEAMYNTGAGIIETGDANTGVSLLNMANTNITAKKFVVLFVNVLGSFVGDIIPTGVWEEAYNSNYYQGASPLTSIAPLSAISPLEDDTLPRGGVDELTAYQETGSNQQNAYNNYYYYPQYQSEQIQDNYYFYPPEYVNSVYLLAGQRNQLALLKNKYANNNQGSVQNLTGEPRILRRGTSVTTNFVKATRSANILLGGISLKVTNSWLLFIPFALFIFVFRRRNRINIDFNRYINMLLEIIL